MADAADPRCLACTPPCRWCDADTNACTKCNDWSTDNRALDADASRCVTDCPAEFWEDHSDNTDPTCEACTGDCKECSTSATTCTKCVIDIDIAA